MLSHQFLKRFNAFHSTVGTAVISQFAAITIRGRRLDSLEHQRPEGAMVNADPTDADCAESIAVIGVAKGDKAAPLRLSPMHTVLVRHFDRHFHGG